MWLKMQFISISMIRRATNVFAALLKVSSAPPLASFQEGSLTFGLVYWWYLLSLKLTELTSFQDLSPNSRVFYLKYKHAMSLTISVYFHWIVSTTIRFNSQSSEVFALCLWLHVFTTRQNDFTSNNFHSKMFTTTRVKF